MQSGGDVTEDDERLRWSRERLRTDRVLIALTRSVSASIERCELTHLERESINVEYAAQQHHHYEQCLTELGCEVVRLSAEPDLPDAVFVEDTAVVLDELAIITRPGAKSRRAETVSIARGLALYRKLSYIQPPGTLDGGDVLRVGRDLFVGSSERSNPDGIQQLRAILSPFGYSVTPLEIRGCLHLKSAVTQVGINRLLINQDWVDASAFRDFELIHTHPEEPMAANALLVDDAVVYPEAFSRTRLRLEERGINVRIVDMSELQKAEGGVTCCSLIFTV